MEHTEGTQPSEYERTSMQRISQMLDTLLGDYSQSRQQTVEHIEQPQSPLLNQSAGISPYPLRTAMVREAHITGTRTKDRLVSAQPQPDIIETVDNNPRVPIHIFLVHSPETQLLMGYELKLMAHTLAQWQPILDGKPANADIQVHYIHPTTSQAERITVSDVINCANDPDQSVQGILNALTAPLAPISTDLGNIMAVNSSTDTAQYVEAIKAQLSVTDGIKCIFGNAPDAVFFEDVSTVNQIKEIVVGIVEKGRELTIAIQNIEV